jgi:predicted MFS family arabinose efflux permease
MEIAVIYAFVVVVGAPLIGIWTAHRWAKAHGLVLRSATAADEQSLTA